MYKLVKFAIVMFLLVATSFAYANFSCSVKINKVLVYSSGAVNILHTGRSDYTYICNLKTEWNGVSITTCAMWTSMLQNIKKNAGNAAFYYSGDGSCSTLPTYGNAPAPVYIGDI